MGWLFRNKYLIIRKNTIKKQLFNQIGNIIPITKTNNL